MLVVLLGIIIFLNKKKLRFANDVINTDTYKNTTMTNTGLQVINRYRGTAPEEGGINLTWPERYISIAGGVKLGISGFKNLFRSPFSSILKIGASGYLLTRGVTGHCELYTQMGKTSTDDAVNVNIRSSFAVSKPRQQVYEFWRQLDNLPLFMKHLESVSI
ncbi:MAG: DUF2892 domain-containing protein, partial [Sphingobacteriaceae bacterium]